MICTSSFVFPAASRASKEANKAADLRPEDCMYQKTRDKFPGGMEYEVRKRFIINDLNKLKEKNNGSTKK